VSLREAASVVFGLVAILPILLFVYLLSRADMLRRPEVQVSVVLALVVSVVGFLLFRRMVGQVSRLAEGLQAPKPSQPGSPETSSPLTAVPGLGQVTEIGQVTSAFYQMLDDLRGATQRLEDLVFKLGTLNETVELAARIPRIQDLLGQVLQTTMRAVRASTGSIMILDQESQTLRLAAARGLPEHVVSDVEVKAGEGITGEVVARGEPILVDDIDADPRLRTPSAPVYGSGSFLCMPIRAGDRIIGVINMAKRKDVGEARPQPFSSIDVQFLNALMTYIGYAVDNARLLAEARQSAQQLQTVVDDLKTTQEQLVRGETLRAMGQLSSGMAHHMNNLFAVILGRTELLLANVGTMATRRSLEIIQRAAQDGADVARRVQRFSRAHPVAEPVAVDVNALALEAVELAQRRPEGARDRIELGVEAGRIPAAMGEAAPLRESLVNLLLNAMDAMPDGGQATVRTWTEADRVHCAVIDSGVGMSDEIRRRALEPFFTTKGPKSTGLGLSVAYGAVQRYGGTLKIDSALGRGTTVTVSLPMAAPAAAAEVQATPERTVAGVPLRILVVDDEADVRETLVDLLEEDGHVVVQAADGDGAVTRLKGGEVFDVVLTDLAMPGMTGWDVARAVHEGWPRLPVALITGWGEQTMTREEKSRVDFVITKPFDRGQLRATLAAARSPA
jgi:signal transduction histidine kinase